MTVLHLSQTAERPVIRDLLRIELRAEASGADDPSAVAVGRVARSELWRAVNAELRSDDERLVARLSFLRGLTPREIFARHPDRFEDVVSIYRIKRNIVDRLRHSRAIRRLASV